MFVGSRIKELRIRQGLTQEALGLLVDVSKVSICNYENNKKTPTLDHLYKLADSLNTSINYLLGEDINIIMEDSPEYNVNISSADINIIKLLKKSEKLYIKLLEEPKRTISIIEKRLEL